MIPELDRYQGIVLRQIVAAYKYPLRIGVADLSGRVDAFSIEGAAFQVKHCSKRMSPWTFTYLPENLAELRGLREKYHPVWVFLVCGQDGVVGLSDAELDSMTEAGSGGAAWLRVSRSRNSMYRVSGAAGSLAHAKARGVQVFLGELAGALS